MNLLYVVPRVARHFLPEWTRRFLLRRSILLIPGLETVDPSAAAARYLRVVNAQGRSLTGKRALVFGYGGRFELGVRLLEAGTEHVVLCDKFAPPDDRSNAALLARHGQYLIRENGRPRPRPEKMTLIEADIRAVHASAELPACNYVFSNSVYEHLEDVNGVTCALAGLTVPDGLHVHYVDLRDHFFKYPFEMLTYSERVWQRWLNPTSHHNRFRLWHYRAVFEQYFEKVEIEVLRRDQHGFERTRARLRPEFVSGNIQDDSVTSLVVIASNPRQSAA